MLGGGFPGMAGAGRKDKDGKENGPHDHDEHNGVEYGYLDEKVVELLRQVRLRGQGIQRILHSRPSTVGAADAATSFSPGTAQRRKAPRNPAVTHSSTHPKGILSTESDGTIRM